MQDSTPANDGGTDQSDSLTPDDVAGLFPRRDETADPDSAADVATAFERLFAPRTRAGVIDVLWSDPERAWTVAEIVDHSGNVSTSGFERHKDALLSTGVVQEAGKKGNAQTYRLNTRHPVAQLLVMLDTVIGYGRTPMLLEEQFVGEPGAGDGVEVDE
jgi:hypothetical protein